jgi:hypothetical protein
LRARKSAKFSCYFIAARPKWELFSKSKKIGDVRNPTRF